MKYIQIGDNYRLTGIGGIDSKFYQVWKKISGGTYRKVNLQISILKDIDFEKTQYLLHLLINQFVSKKMSSKGYVISPKEFKQIENISTDNILKIASEIKLDETITIFYKTK